MARKNEITVDYSRALVAEDREVQDRDHAGNPARVVIASPSFTTQANELWDALTNIDRIPGWFAPITGNLALGGRYQIEGNAGGEITRCDPHQAIDVTWEIFGNVSWVTVRLEQQGNETKLMLEHIMLKDPASETHWRQYGPGATGVGWDLSFLGLALHLASGGKAVDQDAINAWMASDEGKTFLHGCADGWSTAHIAAGEDPDVARQMAEHTHAFYSG